MLYKQVATREVHVQKKMEVHVQKMENRKLNFSVSINCGNGEDEGESQGPMDRSLNGLHQESYLLVRAVIVYLSQEI